MKLIRVLAIYLINKFPISWKWTLFYLLNNKLRIDFFKTRSDLFSHYSKIIIIGANDGLSFDNLFQNLDPNNVSGIVIEPSKKYFSILKQNLSSFNSIIFLNVAITNKEDNFVLYQLNDVGLEKLPEWGKGLGSFAIENLLKFSEISNEDIEIEIVKGLTFESILNEYSLFEIDYLQIDTEGFDGKIIKMIDFNFFSPKMLKFEWVNLEPTEVRECKNKLRSHDFLVLELGGDIVAYSKSINPIFY